MLSIVKVGISNKGTGAYIFSASAKVGLFNISAIVEEPKYKQEENSNPKKMNIISNWRTKYFCSSFFNFGRK